MLLDINRYLSRYITCIHTCKTVKSSKARSLP